MSAAASRRSFLSAAAAASVASLQGYAPAFAVSAPEKLEVAGLLAPRNTLNGVWSIVPGKQVNSRAVYQKDGQNAYLMFNDCNQFQMATTITGVCNGFATEEKGKWTLDGKECGTLKIKPLGAKPKAVAAVEVPEEGQDVGFFKLPKFTFSGKESDDELLSIGESVNSYIKAKGGGNSGGYLNNVMRLEDGEQKTADSLEARLNAKMR